VSQVPIGDSGGASPSDKPPISSGIGGLSDILGSVMAFGQQNSENQAITGTGNELQDELGLLGGEAHQSYSNYENNAVPAENAIIGSAPGEIAGYQAGAASGYGSEAGYGSQLGASPYPGLDMAAGAGAEGSQEANAAALENWHGLGNKELGEATTVASNAALSAANTEKAQSGGVPNAGAAFEEAANTAAQAGMQTGSQLGAMAQEQELGAKEAAGQEYGAVAGEQIGQTEAAGQQYATDVSGAGELEGASAQGLAGLSEQDIQELESSLSEEGTMAQAGMSGQEYGASDWTSLLENEMLNAQGQQNPFSGMASGITSLLPLLGVAV
jgi:hypothetical protein